MSTSPFGIVPVEIFEAGLHPSSVAVFVALATFADRDRIAFPGLARLSEMVGITERNVRLHLRKLEDAGMITTVPAYDDNGRQRTNVYKLDLLLSSPRPDTSDRGEGVTDNRGEGVTDNPQTVPDIPVPEGTGSPPVAPPPEKPNGKRRRVPPDWTPDDRCRAYAAEKGNTDDQINDLAEQFRDFHTAKGSQFADIDAAWRTWCRNDIEFNGPPDRRGNRQRNDGATAPYAAALDKLATIPADDIRRRY